MSRTKFKIDKTENILRNLIAIKTIPLTLGCEIFDYIDSDNSTFYIVLYTLNKFYFIFRNY